VVSIAAERLDSRLDSERLDGDPLDPAEVLLVLRPDEEREAQEECRGRNRQVVGRNAVAPALEGGEEVRPDLGNLGAEIDHRCKRQDGVDLGAPLGGPPGICGEAHAREKLGDDDRRDGDLLVGQRTESVGQRGAGTLERDEGAGVED